MRIAMLSWETLHSITVGGVSQHVTELSAALARQGHEVHVFTRRASGQALHDQVDGVHYHRCNYQGHHDFVDDINNMCRAMVDKVFEVEDRVGHFDAVHAHDWLTANAMIWIKKGRGHKCILTIHSTEYARCGNTFPGGRSGRIRDQERAGTYWADQVIAVSHATRKEITWMYEVPEWKTQTVYNGVSPHRFDVEVDQGAMKRAHAIGPMDPTVLFCGRLEHQKGPDLLVEAIPAILRDHPRAKFVFAGEGGMRGRLETRARQLGAGDAVRFTGFRNNGELVSLFKMADVVCVPSRNEPFGIVVLEAWSARKPVVVTQSGGPNEYVGHGETGLKIYPHVESVAWGLRTMFSDFDRARWMGENGRRTVEEKFTWDHIAGQTLAVYDPGLAAAKPAPQQANETVPLPMLAPPQGESKPAPTAVGVAVAVETSPAVDENLTPLVMPAASVRIRVVARLVLRAAGGEESLSKALAACKSVLAAAGAQVHWRGNTISVEGEWEDVSAVVHGCYAAVSQDAEVEITTSIRPAPAQLSGAEAEDRTGLREPKPDPSWARRTGKRKNATALSVA